MERKKSPTWGPLSTRRPLIILQTNNRFNDSDEDYGISGEPMAEARRHGREAVRAWKEAVPEDIQPFCHLQVELRMQNHQVRYDRFRQLLEPFQSENIPVNLQVADPHDMFVFDPVYIEKLINEFSCIQSLTLTEINYEHYRSFNVPRYALSPEALYTMDMIELAAGHGKYLSISLQGLKWMHIASDVLNKPLFDKVREFGDYVLPVNEHIGPQHLPRQTSVWGLWMAGITTHWGVEPQSWWFENSRMIRPGYFGQYQPDNTRNMPKEFYRAMILQGALLGATVYQFEPFWDLFDYDNGICWKEVIYPTLMEAIRDELISDKGQCFAKARVAYQYNYSRDINEFHENLRDVDFEQDEGFLARASYGVWERLLEHELIPNKSRYFFIPLLPPDTEKAILEQFEYVIHPGECNSEKEYEDLLNRFYPQDYVGTAWQASFEDHVFIMQSHENLYEEQTYELSLPKALRGLRGHWEARGFNLEWANTDSGVVLWRLLKSEKEAPFVWQEIAISPRASYLDTTAIQGKTCFYAVVAETSTLETVRGSVNYLDYLVFNRSKSRVVEYLYLDANGSVVNGSVGEEPDVRPKSQIVYPTFDGAEEYLKEAREIVQCIDQFKKAYDHAQYDDLIALYDATYEDANGFHLEYAKRAWKFWFDRNNSFCFLRQTRRWDFSLYQDLGRVQVHLFALCRAFRRDDAPFGSKYDGTVRIPRTEDEEVTFTWRKERDGRWKIVRTDPALPNFQEILWNSRGSDKTWLRLIPGVEGRYGEMPKGKTNLIPLETNWLPIMRRDGQ